MVQCHERELVQLKDRVPVEIMTQRLVESEIAVCKILLRWLRFHICFSYLVTVEFLVSLLCYLWQWFNAKN